MSVTDSTRPTAAPRTPSSPAMAPDVIRILQPRVSASRNHSSWPSSPPTLITKTSFRSRRQTGTISSSEAPVAASTTRSEARTSRSRSRTGGDGDRRPASASARIRVRLCRPDSPAGILPASMARAIPVPIVPHPAIPICSMMTFPAVGARLPIRLGRGGRRLTLRIENASGRMPGRRRRRSGGSVSRKLQREFALAGAGELRWLAMKAVVYPGFHSQSAGQTGHLPERRIDRLRPIALGLAIGFRRPPVGRS